MPANNEFPVDIVFTSEDGWRGVESRRGLANGDLIRRCRRVQLAGEQATKLGAVAPEECLQNSARVPDCCLYSAVSAVRLALRHGQGTSREIGRASCRER